MEYSRNFGSQYPEVQMTVSEKKDIDNNVLNIINQVETYVNNRDLAEAAKLMEENAALLEPYTINSEFFNLIQEEIYNIGLLAISKQNSMVSAIQPTTQTVAGSYWIKDIEFVEEGDVID
jgi:hypothetical protein